MPFDIDASQPRQVVRLHGVDIRQPVDAATLARIKQALADHGAAAIGHDTPPTDEQHIAFSGQLGPMDRGRETKFGGFGERVKHPEIVDQSNLNEVGELYSDSDRRLAYKRANRLWHTDMSFFDIRATYSLLNAHSIPPSGADTQFIDMRKVWEALPENRKAGLDELVVEHSYWHSRVLGGGPAPSEEELAAHPPARHKMVHVHAPSGRTSLYIASHSCGIVGWPKDKAMALINELMAFATQDRFVYAHKWKLGDVLIWDNLATLHRATEFEDTKFPRDVRRTTCRERSLVNGKVRIE